MTIPVVPYTAWVVAEAVFFAWIFVNTGGSALMATLFHAAANATEFLYAGFDPASVYWLRAGISVVIALVVVLATGPSLARRAAVVPTGCARRPFCLSRLVK